MRKTVLVPVECAYCDAHIARDGSEAAKTLALGNPTVTILGRALQEGICAGQSRMAR